MQMASIMPYYAYGYASFYDYTTNYGFQISANTTNPVLNVLYMPGGASAVLNGNTSSCMFQLVPTTVPMITGGYPTFTNTMNSSCCQPATINVASVNQTGTSYTAAVIYTFSSSSLSSPACMAIPGLQATTNSWVTYTTTGMSGTAYWQDTNYWFQWSVSTSGNSLSGWYTNTTSSQTCMFSYTNGGSGPNGSFGAKFTIGALGLVFIALMNMF